MTVAAAAFADARRGQGAVVDGDIRRALAALRWARVASARARNPNAVLAEELAEARLNALLERRRPAGQR